MPYLNKALQREAERNYKRRVRATDTITPPLQFDRSREDQKHEPTDVTEWIEHRLKVPTGLLARSPFRLGPWQQDFIRESLAPGIREAALCVARKNGKTGLIAAMLLAYLHGPLNRPGWRCLVTSLTGRLAALMREAVADTAEASGLPVDQRAHPPPGLIRGREGTVVEFLAADRATGHASSADLAIIDEAGLLGEQDRPLWEAMLSSVSARDGRLVAISILGTSPMFAELRERQADPSVVWHGYTAPPDVRLDDRRAWHASNPGLADGIKSIAYMEDMSRRAMAVPASAASFRAYDLNAPGDPTSTMLVQLHDWLPLTRRAQRRDGDCVVGIDLGGARSMSCAVAYWPATGALAAWGAFPGIPPLSERGRNDGVGNLYVRMAERGELATYGDTRTTPLAMFLTQVFGEHLRGENVAAVVADKYGMAEAQDAFSACGIRARRLWTANSWDEAGPNVVAFQRAVADQRLAPGHSLMLESAITETRLLTSPEGKAKLARVRSEGRIDAAQAMVNAVGYGSRSQRGRRSIYRGAA